HIPPRPLRSTLFPYTTLFRSFQRSQAAEVLGIDTERFSLGLILALGRPKEEVVVVPVKEDGDVRYYRDEKQVHYVPKRALEDIIDRKSTRLNSSHVSISYAVF